MQHCSGVALGMLSSTIRVSQSGLLGAESIHLGWARYLSKPSSVTMVVRSSCGCPAPAPPTKTKVPSILDTSWIPLLTLDVVCTPCPCCRALTIAPTQTQNNMAKRAAVGAAPTSKQDVLNSLQSKALELFEQIDTDGNGVIDRWVP